MITLNMIVTRVVLAAILLASAIPAQAEEMLLLFGGKGHDAFLGCLNCSSVESDSVHNSVGTYGSSVSSESIFNSVGEYGSSVSDLSPCNTLADNPPVIVSKSGTFYGYLTLNSLKSGAIRDDDIVEWLERKVCR